VHWCQEIGFIYVINDVIGID